MKNKFRAPLDQKCPLVKNITKSAHFSILDTDAHGRLDDISTHHKPHFHQIKSVFKPIHNMVRSTEERHGAPGDPRLRRQEDRDHAGLAAIDNEAVGGFFEQ